MNPNYLVSVSGKVSPCEWDERGRPTTWLITTLDDEDIVLENSPFDYKLSKYNGKTVEVRGKLLQSVYGVKLLRVKGLRRINLIDDQPEYPVHLQKGFSLFKDNGLEDLYWEVS